MKKPENRKKNAKNAVPTALPAGNLQKQTEAPEVEFVPAATGTAVG
jgi:hypothetical protein